MPSSTPVLDFVRAYASENTVRAHMPGHKGQGPIGCEELDITEIAGADALYEASGILLESERNAAQIFGSARTFYSTEGSSQCIRAMLFLIKTCGAGNTVLAARNAHKSFLYALALNDLNVEWLYPESDTGSLCACPISPEGLDARLSGLDQKPACVYVTSPDYLGEQLDIRELARVAHRHGVPLIVDNAHGAYLKFLMPSQHPMDLGADMCCDSAHKTLPALTGGAYLHIQNPRYIESARRAMALFGSTSPSYLILSSLDACNADLSDGYRERLTSRIEALNAMKLRLKQAGVPVLETEPMKLTIRADGLALMDALRAGGVECEFADREALVMMFSANTPMKDLERVEALLRGPIPPPTGRTVSPGPGKRAMTVREAIFAPQELVPVRSAIGRVCASPAVSCPPAVPIAVSGEMITEDMVQAFLNAGINTVPVVRENV